MKKLILQLTALVLAVVLSGVVACQKKAPSGDGSGGEKKSTGMCG